MDNPLTPKKIQNLINLAEGRSFNIERLLLTEEEVKILAAQANLARQTRSPGYQARYESSSGIIDLDHVEGFGESDSNSNMCLSKSSTFNPGEMTGRSTGTSEAPPISGLGLPQSEPHGRHSIAIGSITSQMNKQTNEVNDLMRHSIASNYSFQSKRDLTADEASLIAREAPLPIFQQTHTYFGDTMSVNNSDLSVGAYFRNRCMDFGNILGKADSPDKSSMMPSITEVSGPRSEHGTDTDPIKIDDTLDSVPVRQPRNNDTCALDKSAASAHTSKYEKSYNSVFKQPMRPKPVEKQATATINSMVQSKTPQHVRYLNPSATAQKSFMTSSKPTDLLLRNFHSSLMPVSDDTGETVENSFSISKIADYLGKQSNVSVTDMLQQQKNAAPKKQPLTELHLNAQVAEELPVTKLINTKRSDTASSAGTVHTVISFENFNMPVLKAPQVVITKPSPERVANEEPRRATRSKSPSSRSPSTLSTVRDNYSNNCSDFKSADSPNFSKDEANRSKIPSPNIAYKELDKSVDWQEVLLQKKIRQRGVAKENWVSITTTPVDGFVGVTTAVTISVRTITDSWLTATFHFNSLPNEGRDLNFELPRLPLLLSPGKTEDFTFHITSNVEMNTVLPFTFHTKDASIDVEVEQKGELTVNFKLPVIQAMSADGLNKLLYPVLPEKTAVTKSFILLSDCPADLQLQLSISEGDSIYCIKNVQEIKKSDVNKVLLERQISEDSAKSKVKAMNKQLCRLVRNCAIKVSITFISPKLDMKLFGKSGIMTTYNGMLEVSLIGSNTFLGRIDLIGLMGIPKLHIEEPENKLHITNEAAKITVCNRGTVVGTWSAKHRYADEGNMPFELRPTRFALGAEESTTIQAFYTGKSDEGVVEIPIHFEELTTGESTELILTGGTDKPKSFPIKSNTITLSWVRAGRKEVSLKNSLDRKVQIRCHITGDGFTIDLPGGESARGVMLTFNPLECRPLPIAFIPPSCIPYAATLHMSLERSQHEKTRKVKLFGCVSGEPVRWSGLVTYSDSAALVRAAFRQNIDLKLHNKSTMPAFIAAKVHFNLQYMHVEPFCQLSGARRVVAGRAVHSLLLRVNWARVEQRAQRAATTALATVTVLTGAEATRRRILRILRKEPNGELDVSLLPEHLRVLTEEFDGEDSNIDDFFAEYTETESSLNELILCGLQELTAHVDLPHDLAEDSTIVISDDTALDHHTLCE